MTFYFVNPVTLILAYSQFGSTIKQAVLVGNYFRGKNFHHYISQMEFNLEYARKLCETLDVQFNSISFQEFMEILIEPDLIEANLCSKRKFDAKTLVIIQSSDVYMAFDETIKLSYLRTRLQLRNAYKNGLRNHLKSPIFLFSKIKFKSNTYQFNYLSKDRFNQIASKIGSSLDLQINEKFIEMSAKRLLLLMPPQIDLVGEKFYNNFINKAIKMAEENELEILIKPHRKDSRNYDNKLSRNQFISIENLSHYPIEFLFNLSCIKLVVSEPSSSLIFATESNLKVFVPKDRSLYRKYYLNQESFLKYTQLKFEYL